MAQPLDVKERFHNAIDNFYDTDHYLAGQVSRLGYPEMSKAVPTAGVAWDKDRKKIAFVFNPDFCERITDEEFRFAVAHEAAHMIYGHVFFLKNEMDALEAENASAAHKNAFKKRFNVAADCVINDSLVNLYGLPKSEFLTPEGKVGIFYGKTTLGFDCHELSVIDVMKVLPDDIGQNSDGEHSLWDSFFNDDGTINKDFVDAIKDFVENTSENSAVSGEEAEEIEKLKEAMQNCGDAYSRQAGQSTESELRSVNYQKACLRWERIFFRKTERKKFEDTWNRRARKLSAFPGDLILPSQKDREVEEIFVAIDVSGSIDYKALDLFVSLVKNFPKHFNVTAVTFNTMCQPFDINSGQVRSGGGTSFYIIEDYIQRNLKKYPQAVFVLTDGEGNIVNPQHPNRWVWMLYGYSCTRYCGNMSYYMLKDLLK